MYCHVATGFFIGRSLARALVEPPCARLRCEESHAGRPRPDKPSVLSPPPRCCGSADACAPWKRAGSTPDMLFTDFCLMPGVLS